MNITFEDLLQFVTQPSKQENGENAQGTVADFQSAQNYEMKNNQHEHENTSEVGKATGSDYDESVPQGFFQFSLSDFVPREQTAFYQEKSDELIESTSKQGQDALGDFPTSFQVANVGEKQDESKQKEQELPFTQAVVQEPIVIPQQHTDNQQLGLHNFSDQQSSGQAFISPRCKVEPIVLDDLLTGGKQDQKSGETTPFDDKSNSLNLNSFPLFDFGKTTNPVEVFGENVNAESVASTEALSKKAHKKKILMFAGIAVVSVCFGFFYLFVTRPLLFESGSTQTRDREISEEMSVKTPLADSIEKKSAESNSDTILSVTGENEGSKEQTFTGSMQTSPTESDFYNQTTLEAETGASSIAPGSEKEQQTTFSGVKDDVLIRLEKAQQDVIKIITHAQRVQERKSFIKGQLLLRSIAKFKNDIESIADVDTGSVLGSLEAIETAIKEMMHDVGISDTSALPETSSESSEMSLPFDQTQSTKETSQTGG